MAEIKDWTETVVVRHRVVLCDRCHKESNIRSTSAEKYRDRPYLCSDCRQPYTFSERNWFIYVQVTEEGWHKDTLAKLFGLKVSTISDILQQRKDWLERKRKSDDFYARHKQDRPKNWQPINFYLERGRDFKRKYHYTGDHWERIGGTP